MQSIDVFIQGEGLIDIVVAPAEPHHKVCDLVASLTHPATENGELLIFVEDMSSPIESDAIIEELVPLDVWDAAIPSPLRLHMSRCRHVDVSVRFNGEFVERRFSPSATIARVQHWAARRAFHMTPRDAAEHVLQLQDATTRPDRDVHIGTLTGGKACCVTFDLVPRKRVEG